MANKHPKVQVTISHELYDALSRLSVLNGSTRSKICKELLEPSIDALNTLSDQLEKVEDTKKLLKLGEKRFKKVIKKARQQELKGV